MATIPTQTHLLLTVPFNADTDFTVLADHCEKLAEAQAECLDPALRMALCGRLGAALALLKTDLQHSVPPHLKDSLTVVSTRWQDDAGGLASGGYYRRVEEKRHIACRRFPQSGAGILHAGKRAYPSLAQRGAADCRSAGRSAGANLALPLP